MALHSKEEISCRVRRKRSFRIEKSDLVIPDSPLRNSLVNRDATRDAPPKDKSSYGKAPDCLWRSDILGAGAPRNQLGWVRFH
jgi:hypothetical protein